MNENVEESSGRSDMHERRPNMQNSDELIITKDENAEENKNQEDNTKNKNEFNETPNIMHKNLLERHGIIIPHAIKSNFQNIFQKIKRNNNPTVNAKYL